MMTQKQVSILILNGRILLVTVMVAGDAHI